MFLGWHQYAYGALAIYWIGDWVNGMDGKRCRTRYTILQSGMQKERIKIQFDVSVRAE